ncbi:Rgg family transcriptional regulator [Globicatella sp. HMSC072A10]|uniref:Rgg family transcriptional regulator n=1 Tax=Globicatella sp. HMSC072A10 TaxID=1739315 RepID=UPI0008AB3EE1|nr:Rgg/GadR/MutR family transcriptional regulator [Globicatella sp. HMSC072A10]OFK56103.1 hypothetical protein HMPREF2811_07335 [Globicatella sp. HMSC072A10]
MKLGYAIEYIRQKRDMPINTLIKDVLSRSTYNRFVNNETRLSLSKFIELSLRLKIDAEDFLQLMDQADLFIREEFYNFDWVDLCSLQHYDRTQLLSAKHFITKLAQEDEYYQHINWYLDLVLEDRYQIPIPKSELIKIESYLRNMPTWYHFEFALLSHTMQHFEDDLLYKAFDQAELYVAKEIYLDYTQVVYTLCSNIYFHLLHKGIPMDLERFEKLIETHPRSHILFKQRVMLHFYRLLVDINNKKNQEKAVKKLIENCQSFGAGTVVQELTQKYQQYLMKYPV